MAASDLFDAADEILTLCNVLLADTVGGAPDRSYVSQGDPVDEGCSELTVRTQLGEGVQGTPGLRHLSGRRNEVTFTIRIVRCLPNRQDDLTAATETQLTTYAQTTYQDAWALWNGIMAAQRAGSFLEGFCKEFEMDGAQPIPNLLVGGWEITIRAVLYAYTPDLGT